MRLGSLSALVLLLLCGCYDSAFDSPSSSRADTPVTSTISELRARYVGEPFRIESDIIVTGRVTSSDRSENFYRTFCVEEEGAAIEVMAGVTQTCNDFPIGCRVKLFLKGLCIAESRGVLQAGLPPEAGSGYPTDYLSSKAALDVVALRCGERIEPIEPMQLTIGELAPEFCGRLVCIESLQYAPDELSESAWSGYKRFVDRAEKEVYTYIRYYASFADEEVPTGIVALTGILQYDGTRYLIKMRDETDCVH